MTETTIESDLFCSNNWIKFIVIIVIVITTLFSSFAQEPVKINSESDLKSKQVLNQKAGWDRKRINCTIIDKSGRSFEGQILYLSDSVIYQYLSHNAYQPGQFFNSTIKFNIDDIERIRIYRKGQTLRGLKHSLIFGSIGTLALTFITEESAWGRLWNLLGATVWVMPASTLTGVIIGSGRKIDIDYIPSDENNTTIKIFTQLNKYALFPNVPPNELVKKTDNAEPDKSLTLNNNEHHKFVNAYNDSLQKKTDRVYNMKSPLYISRFHIETGVGFSLNYRNSVLKNNMEKLGYYESAIKDRYINDIKWGIGLSYQMNNNFRLAFAFYPKSFYEEGIYNKKVRGNLFLSTDTYSYGYSVVVGCDYIYKPVTRMLNSRYEVLAGIGIVQSGLMVNNSISIAELDLNSSVFYDTYNNDFNENLWGLNTKFAFEYYLTRNFSLNLKTTLYILPNLSLPELNVTSNYLKLSGKLEAHSTNISTVDLLLGLHFHF